MKFLNIAEFESILGRKVRFAGNGRDKIDPGIRMPVTASERHGGRTVCVVQVDTCDLLLAEKLGGRHRDVSTLMFSSLGGNFSVSLPVQQIFHLP